VGGKVLLGNTARSVAEVACRLWALPRRWHALARRLRTPGVRGRCLGATAGHTGTEREGGNDLGRLGLGRSQRGAGDHPVRLLWEQNVLVGDVVERRPVALRVRAGRQRGALAARRIIRNPLRLPPHLHTPRSARVSRLSAG